jgi:hypothetical protein
MRACGCRLKRKQRQKLKKKSKGGCDGQTEKTEEQGRSSEQDSEVEEESHFIIGGK